jgi:hypothetical protein
MKLKTFATTLALPLLLAFQCHRDDDFGCTMEFRTIGINVLDSNGLNFIPEVFYVVAIDNNDTIRTHLSEDYGMPPEQVIIFSDNDIVHTNNSENGRAFEFTAYQNQALIAQETYRIRHDNCHVILVSGATNL